MHHFQHKVDFEPLGLWYYLTNSAIHSCNPWRVHFKSMQHLHLVFLFLNWLQKFSSILRKIYTTFGSLRGVLEPLNRCAEFLNLWITAQSSWTFESLCIVLEPLDHCAEFLNLWFTWQSSWTFGSLRRVLEPLNRCAEFLNLWITAQSSYTFKSLCIVLEPLDHCAEFLNL